MTHLASISNENNDPSRDENKYNRMYNLHVINYFPYDNIFSTTGTDHPLASFEKKNIKN